MVFTIEEEEILRLIINELRTRKKLDAIRAEKDSAYRESIAPIKVQVDEVHKAKFDLLQAEFNQVEENIKQKFIEVEEVAK